MNFEFFIAKKISSGYADTYSKPVARISYISIALGLALMIISVAIVIGFKDSISSKIIGFTAHLQIVPFNNNESLEEKPLLTKNGFFQSLEDDKKVKHIQFVAKKAGVIKTDDQIYSVVLKGVGSEYDTSFLVENIVEGSFPSVSESDKTDEVLISKTISDKLQLFTGDEIRVWFITGDDLKARGRKFIISGIYNTGIEEFDQIFIVGDLRHIQKLNGWENGEAGSVEIELFDPSNLEQTSEEIYRNIPFDMNIVSVREQYPQIFNWLDLLDMNVIVILVLMTLVSSITMISTLLIIIIERTSMVGALKAMGANNSSIRKIFLFKASWIIVKGMILGNLVGLAFYFFQLHYRIFKLSPENYYVDYVPVELSFPLFLLLNAATLFICISILIIPSYYITRIVPARALRYE